MAEYTTKLSLTRITGVGVDDSAGGVITVGSAGRMVSLELLSLFPARRKGWETPLVRLMFGVKEESYMTLLTCLTIGMGVRTPRMSFLLDTGSGNLIARCEPPPSVACEGKDALYSSTFLVEPEYRGAGFVLFFQVASFREDLFSFSTMASPVVFLACENVSCYMLLESSCA